MGISQWGEPDQVPFPLDSDEEMTEPLDELPPSSTSCSRRFESGRPKRSETAWGGTRAASRAGDRSARLEACEPCHRWEIELAGDEDGRKPGGSWRAVPPIGPLRALLSREWVAQGRPRPGRVCPPKRIRKSGRKSMRSCKEGLGAAGRRRAWSRSVFTRQGTLRPPGSTTRGLSEGLLQASWSMPEHALIGSSASVSKLVSASQRACAAFGFDRSPRDLDLSFP